MITESAVWHRGTLYKGKRHHDCIRAAVEATNIRPVIGDQGFVTDTGLYLNRAEALMHALECKQYKRNKLEGKFELFSEDLW